MQAPDNIKNTGTVNVDTTDKINGNTKKYVGSVRNELLENIFKLLFFTFYPVPGCTRYQNFSR